MTDTDGPFDTKPWSEAQWARHAAAWAPSGVYGSPAASTTSGDLPLSVSGRSVGLGAGRAWVRGFGFERTGTAVMQDPGANTHASFFRRDRIVLRRNLATHSITQVVIQGTPASSPAAPALTQNEAGSWDLPQYSFLVPPNSGTGITGVVDERGWVDPTTGGLAFLTTAARDANLPSPGAGAVVTVAGRPQAYSGSSWLGGTYTSANYGSALEITVPLGANQTGITPGLGALPNLVLPQPARVTLLNPAVRWNPQAQAEMYVYINGSTVAGFAVSGAGEATSGLICTPLDLPAGTHAVAARWESNGGSTFVADYGFQFLVSSAL